MKKNKRKKRVLTCKNKTEKMLYENHMIEQYSNATFSVK